MAGIITSYERRGARLTQAALLLAAVSPLALHAQSVSPSAPTTANPSIAPAPQPDPAVAPVATAEARAGDPADAAQGEVTVTGVRASIRAAIDEKRKETIISDALSATDIDGLPATNLGDAIATIPGATTHREKGAASEIAIGGLGPFLSSVNVNGRETTTGNGKRSVNFYLFPSELIETVAVNKTSRADLIEGGTSGTIDSRTLKPLDKKKRQITLSARGILTGYDHKLKDKAGIGARLTGSYVDQIDLGSAGTLGVLFGVQYQRGNSPEELLGGGSTWVACRDQVYAATATCTSITPQQYGTAAVPTGTPYYFATSNKNNIQFTTHDRRLAWIGGLQWRSTGGVELSADVELSDYKFTEQRQIFNLSETTRGLSNVVSTPDHVVVSYAGNSYGESTPTYRIQDEKYRGGGLNLIVPVGDHFKLIADASLSRTRRERMDRSVRLRTNPTDIDGAVVPGVTTGSSGGRIPYTFTNFPDGTQGLVLNPAFDPNDYDNYSNAARLRRDDQIRWHKNDAARLDGIYSFDDSVFSSIKVGGRWSKLRFRSIEQDRKEYTFNTGATATPFNGAPGAYTITLAQMAAANRACRLPFPQDDFLSKDKNNTLTSWASFDPRCLFQQFIGTEDPGPSADTRSFSNRDVRETTKAAYVMANFAGDLGRIPVTGNLGLRYIDTDVTSRGLRGDFNVVPTGTPAAPTIRLVSTGQFIPLTDTFSYRRWLPSVNLSFDVSDKFKVRYAVSRSMTKPDPASLANGRSFDTTRDFTDVASAVASITVTGNPYTRPLMAWNVDTSLEYYLNRDSVFSLRLFHKDFQGGFVNVLRNETYTIGGTAYTVPVNQLQSTDQTNHIDGFELAGSYRASFLPGILSGLGFRGSWSYAKSNFEQEDLRLGQQIDPVTGRVYPGLVPPVDIFGLSKHVVTASPYFQYKGFEVSAIYKYRSQYYQQFVGDPSQNRTVRSEGTLDLNARLKLTSNLILQAQATNVTDKPRLQDMPTPGSFKEASYYGPTYFFGATLKF